MEAIIDYTEYFIKYGNQKPIKVPEKEFTKKCFEYTLMTSECKVHHERDKITLLWELNC